MKSPQSRTCEGPESVFRAGVGGQNHSLLNKTPSRQAFRPWAQRATLLAKLTM